MVQSPVSPLLSPVVGGGQSPLEEPLEMTVPTRCENPVSVAIDGNDVRSPERTVRKWEEAVREVTESLQRVETCGLTLQRWKETLGSYREKWWEVERNIDCTSSRWEQSKLRRLSVRLRAFTNDARTRRNQSLRMKDEAEHCARLAIVRFQAVDHALRRGLPYEVALRANRLLSDDQTDSEDSDC